MPPPIDAVPQPTIARLPGVEWPEDHMTYEEWEPTVPKSLTSDTLWKVMAYRLALYSGVIGLEDVALLAAHPRGKSMVDQLERAVTSISSDIAEGYSRRFRKEKNHFYDYAIGSAREARDRYFKARIVLPADLVDARLDTLTQVVKLVTVMVARDRRKRREEKERGES
ncbi:MAG TPA: four helix bundle protein [Gemmatimonadaceae bacterium]|nr:four helix bundle protein [Gemmatimonadaceae bacterium]